MLSFRSAAPRWGWVCALISGLASGCGGSNTDLGVIDDDAGADSDQGGGDTGGGEGSPDGKADTAPDSKPSDGGDAGTTDSKADSGDTSIGDTGGGDTGSGDTGSGDTASGDTGSGDTGSGDTGSGDTGTADTGTIDTGVDTCAPTSCYTGPSGTLGVGVCHAGTAACAGGPCVGAVTPSAEICDGLDNDCNGIVDDGNPGGGASCGPSLGGCVSVTTCVSGSLVCRGTFVAPSPTGSASNPGTQSAPLASIDAAIANAVLIGGGADVCVCAPTASGATFAEDVTMVEGTSVLGGYHCTDWSRTIATYVTRIQDVDANGVDFPAGITAITALDGMTVLGQALTTGTSTAITVTDSSPTLQDVTTTGGAAPTSIGLEVGRTTGVSSPTITRGNYSANATSGGTQTAVELDQTTATFLNASLANGFAGSSPTAATSTALRCVDCGATSFTGGSMNGGAATTSIAGLWASGDVTGFTLGGATFVNGGVATASSGTPTARGVFLDKCTGSPKFSGTPIQGGGGPMGLRVGMDVTNPATGSCNPQVTGGSITGCEGGGTCIGFRSDGAPATVTGAMIRGAFSATTGAFGVRCLNGGCTSFTNDTIVAGPISTAAGGGIGVEIFSASPTFDGNNITAPSCTASAVPVGPFYGMRLEQTSATITNNVIRDAACNALEEVVRFDKGVAPAIPSPIVVNDTIEYTPCTGCGARYGLGIKSSGSAPAAGVFNNDIIRSTAAGGVTYPVYEYDANSDMSSFVDDDLHDTTAAALFFFHGTTPLATIALVNTTVPSASGNISGNPNLTATWHLTAGSPCIDVGTASSAPRHDFDGDARPLGAGYDIGADEF